MDINTVLKECGALLDGHFLLSSGRHSNKYFQCARLLQYPDLAEAVLSYVADSIRSEIRVGLLSVDVVVGPALGGIIVAYELGRLLGLPAMFTERDENAVMSLRRGFQIEPGSCVLIAEDVVTTGRSSGECKAVIESKGAKVTALACIVDRRSVHETEKALPFYSSIKVDVQSWDSSECLLCKQGIPYTKPGSRAAGPEAGPALHP